MEITEQCEMDGCNNEYVLTLDISNVDKSGKRTKKTAEIKMCEDCAEKFIEMESGKGTISPIENDISDIE